jgi:hypothetical protein
MTRQDIRGHLPSGGHSSRMPGTGLLERVLVLNDAGAVNPVPPLVMSWVGSDVAARRIGRHPVSVLELAGPWALAAVPAGGMEHSDESAAAQASHLRRPELGSWPEQLLGILTEFAFRLESAL